MQGDVLFLDIDGCLSRGKYAPFDIAALKQLEASVKASPTEVVLCTGRSLSYIEALSQFFRPGRYAVTDHGALVYDYLSDEYIFSPLMSPAVQEKISQLRQYLQKHKDAFPTRWKMSHGKLASVSLVAEEGKDAFALREVVEAHLSVEGFELLCSGRALDIVPAGINKWAGITFFLSLTGLAPEQLAAVGDSHGDLPMLTRADFAACPANADKAVQAVCDYVSPQAEIYGVSDIFTRFF